MHRFSQLLAVGFTTAAVVLAASAPAKAQYMYGDPDLATGEKYHFEVAYGLWYPEPEMFVASDSFGISGTNISLVTDLGAQQEWLHDIRVVVRPAKLHKIRFQFTNIKYDSESVLSRTIVFNGVTYTIGVPVASEVQWKDYRLGYQFDFISRSRGFVGAIAEVKWSDVKVGLASPLFAELTEVRAPIPALGVIGRGYVLPNVAVTGEFTAFKLPGSIDDFEDDSGSFFEYDVYGTLNFVNNVGVQFGWRRVDVDFFVDGVFGDLKLQGIYFNGVVRF